MASRGKSLGVDWTLPGKKRPFATSTVADSLGIVLCAERGLTVREARVALIYASTEQSAVLDGFEAAGYGDTTLTDLQVR